MDRQWQAAAASHHDRRHDRGFLCIADAMTAAPRSAIAGDNGPRTSSQAPLPRYNPAWDLVGLALVGSAYFALLLSPGFLCCLLAGLNTSDAFSLAMTCGWCFLIDSFFWLAASLLTFLLFDFMMIGGREEQRCGVPVAAD
jgi:hypothetical protein